MKYWPVSTFPLKDSIRNIDRVTVDDMLEVSRELFHYRNMTITSLGAADESDLKDVDWSLI